MNIKEDLLWEIVLNTQGKWEIVHKQIKNYRTTLNEKFKGKFRDHFLMDHLYKKLKKDDSIDLFIDATAGLMGDGFALMDLAKKLKKNFWVFESSLILQELIQKSIPFNGVSSQFFPQTFHSGLIENLVQQTKKICLIYDPMFEFAESKSLPKLPMQVLRELSTLEVFPELEWRKLLNMVSIVIVKRTPNAPYLFEKSNEFIKPHYSIESKLTRWDFYKNFNS